MHTPLQLVPTGTRSALAAGARRPQVCHTYQRPLVRELPLRLEPVAPETFGGLVLTTTTHLRGAQS